VSPARLLAQGRACVAHADCLWFGASGKRAMLQDRELTCKECGTVFVFTVGEQEFYLTKGLQHAPQRCETCRKAMQAVTGSQRRPNDFERGPRAGVFSRDTESARDGVGKWARRQMTEIRCVQCGEVTMVPFQPRGDRPVYCKSCYAQARGMQGSEFR